MKALRILLSGFVLFTGSISCSDCDDCLDLQQKNISILDAQGNNLLFGDSAIFDPSFVSISSEGRPISLLFVEEETETLLFALEEGQTTYTLQLDENTSAILTFELGERKSNRCCGNQVYSTATSLNGQTIDNSDIIRIVL